MRASFALLLLPVCAALAADQDFNGRWDITAHTQPRPRAFWLELTGAGTWLNIVPVALPFPPQPVGTSSLAQQVTVTNENTSTVNITSVSVSGTNAKDFSQSNTCGSQLNAGASCTISVMFTPKKTGARSAEIDITDDAGASPQVISLSGTGT